MVDANESDDMQLYIDGSECVVDENDSVDGSECVVDQNDSVDGSEFDDDTNNKRRGVTSMW